MNRLEVRHRRILALSLQGYQPAETSAQLGCTERKVYRLLERIRQWLERMPDEAD